MTELSPQAQAVLDAATERWLDVDDDIPAQVAVAALRAAAVQLAQVPSVIGEPLRGNIAKDAAVVHVADLFAIATELENK